MTKFGYTYYFSEKQKYVKCIYKSNDGEWHGEAKCSPDDEFDLEKGKELAKKRALLRAKKERISRIGSFNDILKALTNAQTLLDKVRSISDDYVRLKHGIEILEKEIKSF